MSLNVPVNAPSNLSKHSTGQESSAPSFEQFAGGKATLNSATQTQRPTDEKPKTLIQKLLGLPAYHWLLLAQVLVIFPHALHLPFWIFVPAVLTLLAQLPVVKAKRFATPRGYQGAQLLIFISGVVGLFLTFGLAFGVEMGVSFLLLCLISKLWELYKRRDAYVVLNLSLFVLASLFLLNQGLSTTLQVLLGSSAVLMAFIALNDDGNRTGEGRVRSFALLTGCALPLMIVLFLFFPRLPPLWSLQLSSAQATTGVSDSMSPGDFANLSQSTELAFRVEFDKPMPPQHELYWRGLVFSDFDGITWTQSPNIALWTPSATTDSPPAWVDSAWQSVADDEKTNPLSYRIRLEPTNNTWVYGLDYPFSSDAYLTSVFTLKRREPVLQAISYEAVRFKDMQIDPTLSEEQRQTNTALPAKGNTQARAFAKQLFAQANNNPTDYVQAVQRWINTDEFRYTLSPPPLGNNRIDEFLFDTKAGFCEHYSSSFTFMMRAVGIPARVVAGYQGGELGRDGSSWEVRQMDAHAWTEIWLEGQGWVRVDPTAFVAPERVEQGMDALTNQQGAALFGSGATAQLSYQQFKMLQRLRRLSDQANYYWQRDIVGYDQDKQANALLRWFNIKSVMSQVAIMAGILAGIIALVVGIIWYRRRKIWHPADRPMQALSKRFGKVGEHLARYPDEGVLAWLNRLQTDPEIDLTDTQKQHLIEMASLYRRLRYGKFSTLKANDPAYQDALKRLNSISRTL